jgi:branched-subunit amino acid transport protein
MMGSFTYLNRAIKINLVRYVKLPIIAFDKRTIPQNPANLIIVSQFPEVLSKKQYERPTGSCSDSAIRFKDLRHMNSYV